MTRIALLTVLLAVAAGCSRRDAATDARPVPVKLAVAEHTNIRDLIEAEGTLYPKRQARITAQFVAPIRDVLVAKGEYVETGDPLAILDDRDLLAKRESDLATLQSARAELQRALNSQLFAEGDRLRTDVRSPSRPNMLANAPPAVNSRAGVVAAQNNVREAEAKLDAINAQLQHARILTPFNGTIVEQFQRIGDMASPSSAMFTLMDLSTVNARANIPRDAAARLRVGLPCTFQSGTLSRSGTVALPGATADPAAPTIEASCEMPNMDGKLTAGLFGPVTIDTQARRNVLTVPKSAVGARSGARARWVFTVDDKNVAHRRDITAGITADGRVEIRSGLQPGEKVAVDNLERLREGAPVQPGH